MKMLPGDAVASQSAVLMAAVAGAAWLSLGAGHLVAGQVDLVCAWRAILCMHSRSVAHRVYFHALLDRSSVLLARKESN